MGQIILPVDGPVEINGEVGEVSDGYHTFNELYRYRTPYNAAFASLAHNMEKMGFVEGYNAHKSKKHSDGEDCFGGGWFVVMITLPNNGGQISNHYPIIDWDLFDIPEREFAEKWDGHTPEEAAERMTKWLTYHLPA